ncbi:pectin esterase [Pseudoxanthomonas sacheonensis]|nr:pectin esterase [Pseudoxanthomonas sacheonensis]
MLLALLAAAPAAIGRAPITVSTDGHGDYRSVQAAVDAAVASGAAATIRIRAGNYREVVDIPAGAPPLHLLGDDVRNTLIVFDNHASRRNPQTGQPFGTSGSATVFVRADDFIAERLTFANDAGPVGQAVAVAVIGTRVAFRDVRFLGRQDTLYTQGKSGLSYFRDCYIEDTVDFVFGAGTALFENCELHSVGDGYVTAAATPEGAAYGYVFRSCRLTAAPGVKRVYLGRPWREHAQVAILDSQLGTHIAPEGWHDWGKPERQNTAIYIEAGNTGSGAANARRVPWSRQLQQVPVDAFDRTRILGAWEPFE